MPRYIFISFLFMGWAFYELSGGADFEPPRAMPAESVQTADVQPDATAVAPQTPETSPVPRVRTVSVAADGAQTPAVRLRAETNTQADAPQPAIDLPRLGLASGTTDADGFDSPVTLASLDAESLQIGNPLDTFQPSVANTVVDAPVVEEVPMDLRTVTGSRVNMRNGPGTTYSILARLLQGSEVEVLSDPGDGWLQLRVVDSGQVGWMAASLVSASAE